MDINFIIKHADRIWTEIRWKDGKRCECGCEKLWKTGDGRYRCSKCRKIFSETSGTLLHYSKVEKWQWLVCIYYMSCTKGISTRELSRILGINYNTAYLMQQKVRYAMANDNAIMKGMIRMDEAYIGGWSSMHFKKKLDYIKKVGLAEKNATRYTPYMMMKGSSMRKFPVVCMVDETNKVKLIHCPNPITQETIRLLLSKDTHAGITGLITDESSLYIKQRVPVEQSNHSRHIYMTKNGTTSNYCENVFSWVKRKWSGIYTHTTNKYLQLYLNQMAFSYNHLKETDQERFYSLLYICMHAYVRNEDIYDFNYMNYFEEQNELRKLYACTKCGSTRIWRWGKDRYKCADCGAHYHHYTLMR